MKRSATILLAGLGAILYSWSGGDARATTGQVDPPDWAVQEAAFGMPVYPGLTRIHEQVGGAMKAVSAYTDDSLEDVLAFYSKHLAGWNFKEDDAAPGLLPPVYIFWEGDPYEAIHPISVLTQPMVRIHPYRGITYDTVGVFYRYGEWAMPALTERDRDSGPPDGMVLIPAGEFEMGDSFNESAQWEVPVHTVYVSAIYMDRHPVSHAQWDKVYTWALANGYQFDNAGSGKDSDHPVHSINWYDAVKWCNARSEMEGRTPAYYISASYAPRDVYRRGREDIHIHRVRWGAGYRLPTEAEWERAARGGLHGQRFPWGNTINHRYANYRSHTGSPYDTSPKSGDHPNHAHDPRPYTSPVGAFEPNEYGLHDMVGNVRVWCWDWARRLYSDAPLTNPRGHDASSSMGHQRLLRGSSYGSSPYDCRVSFRNQALQPERTCESVGFRTVLYRQPSSEKENP